MPRPPVGRGTVTSPPSNRDAARVAAGYALADGYDADEGTSILVARRDPRSTSGAQFSDFALWDPVTDREVDSLDEVSDGDIEGLGWAGRDTLVGMHLPQQRFTWFDVDSSQIVDGESIGPECDHVWAPADRDRGTAVCSTDRCGRSTRRRGAVPDPSSTPVAT